MTLGRIIFISGALLFLSDVILAIIFLVKKTPFLPKAEDQVFPVEQQPANHMARRPELVITGAGGVLGAATSLSQKTGAEYPPGYPNNAAYSKQGAQSSPYEMWQ